MYNRYLQNHAARPLPGGSPPAPAAVQAPQAAKQAPPAPVAQSGGLLGSGGLKGLLRGLLGNNTDLGDLLLILILLLLYLEKEDEELLIVLSALVVMGLQ